MAVICFDYDGTIADTLSLEEKYYLPALKRHGVTVFQNMDDLKKACHENYYSFCKKHGISDETLSAAAEEYKAMVKSHDEVIPFFEGMSELLCKLFEKHTLYVVSHNEAASIARHLEKKQLYGFREIIGYETSRSKKESLSVIRSRHEGEEVYFISDVSGDMIEATDAQIPHIIGVSYGWGTGAELLDAGAHRVFDTVAELGAYLDKIE